MEKSLFFHPIIVRDNKNGIAFSCSILNGDGKKIETIEALNEAVLSFGKSYGNLNVNGSYQGQQILNYYFEKKKGVVQFRLRYFDTKDNKLKSMEAPAITPDYMSDGVNKLL